MADYYLCGWGQVLNAVIPAGARDRSGTKTRTFIEAVPEAQLPAPAPELTAKQKGVLAKLRELGRPVEVAELTRLALPLLRILRARHPGVGDADRARAVQHGPRGRSG